MKQKIEHWRSYDGVELTVRRAGGPAKLRGLIGMPPPGPACALLLPGCRSVHGFGMAYAIDVLFLDDGLRVLRVAALRPARALICRDAACSMELRAGECDRLGIAAGDRFRTRFDGVTPSAWGA